jgi:hypothetical protein
MLEINPVFPLFPVPMPKKTGRDDDRPEKQLRKKKQEAEQEDAQPMQHIDEIV